MTISKETATVYRGGRRRYFSKKSAVRAEAMAIIKEKYPTERPEYEQGHLITRGFIALRYRVLASCCAE